MSTSLPSIAKRLVDKVAVITGGASGIGESTARLFVNHGAKVVIADVQDDLGQSICQELNGSYQNALFRRCDVTKDEDVQNAVDAAVSTFGKLDIMFNNAGIADQLKPSVLDIDNNDFQRVLGVNIFGSFLGAKHAARVMIPQRKGCILFTGSAASVTTTGTLHAYKASKHALVGLTQNFGAELGRYGIRVNCISPDAIATPLFQTIYGMEESEFEKWQDGMWNLEGARLQAEDVAEAAVYLASDESKCVSGVNLLIDGGITTLNPALTTVAPRTS